MIQKKTGFNKLFFIIALVSALYFTGSSMFPPETNAETAKISRESLYFLTKTGNAMAEIAEAVKPAIVNISTITTEKVTDSPFSPFFDDPFFRKFFVKVFR